MSFEKLKILNDRLFSIDWFDLVTNCDYINLVYNKIKCKYNTIFTDIIPTKTVVLKHKYQFNKYIKSLISNRRILVKHRKYDYCFNEKYRYLTKRIGFEIEKYETQNA